MQEYGIVLEPQQPDEVFEALADVVGDRVFTRNEAISAVADVLNISKADVARHFDKLVRESNIRELEPEIQRGIHQAMCQTILR